MLTDGATLFGIFFILSLLRTDVDFVTEYWYRAILPVILTWIVLEAIGAYNPDIDMRSLPYTSQYILADHDYRRTDDRCRVHLQL